MKQGNEPPIRRTIAEAEPKADGLYRFREGAYSFRAHRSHSVIDRDDGDPLILGRLAHLGIGPGASRSLSASVVTTRGGQLFFVCAAPIRLRALETPSLSRVPSIRYIETAPAGDEGLRVAHSSSSEHPLGAPRIRSHAGASFVCVLSN